MKEVHLGELSLDERETLIRLQSENLITSRDLVGVCIEIHNLSEALEKLEEKKRVLIDHLIKELPRQENDFKTSLSERLETSNWRVTKDWKIYSV